MVTKVKLDDADGMNFRRIPFVVVGLLLIATALVLFKQYTQSKYNILLLSIDTIRADSMSIYGYSKKTTPNIDNWAKDAFVFTSARTLIPTTFPSFAQLFTSKTPFESSIFANSVNYAGQKPALVPINDKHPYFAEILKDHGYVTAAFVNSGSLNGDVTKLDRGFKTYEMHRSWPREGPDQNQQYKSFKNTKSALNWIEKNKDEKFFAWIHYMEPHAPYAPSLEFECTFGDKYCSEISQGRIDEFENDRLGLMGCKIPALPKEKVELYKTLYDGEIATVDKLLKSVFDKLKETGLDKNTIVILFGDHGEGFDHNFYFFHNEELYDSHIRIPFMIKVPNLAPKTINEPISTIQILPTILNLLNISFDKSKITTTPFDSLMENKKYVAPRYNYYINDRRTKFAIQENNLKYILSLPQACVLDNQVNELYDLSKDPNELNNIIDENASKAEQLHKELIKYYSQPYPTVRVNNRQEIGEDVHEELKELGY